MSPRLTSPFFLDEHLFADLHQHLKRIGDTIQTLNQHGENTRHHVTAAHRENAPVLDEASSLLQQKQELQVKQQLLSAFAEHFIVSEEDTLILTSTAQPVDDRFFAILKRVKQIHRDCQILLGNENQRLGLELMEQSSRDLNSGYQKLYRWIQREFKHLNLENPQISSIIRKAIRTLAERPTLFQGCLDFFAEAREHVLTDTFYAALTGSATGSHETPMTKPIEFHAHDPLRYVGDMLAWTHSTTVSEKEALETLFISEGAKFKQGFDAGREAEPWSASESEVFDGEKALIGLVDRNTAGVARGLRQRVEQVLQNHEDAVLLYRISNLVLFYMSTFTKLLGSSSNILTTLIALKESSLKHFRSIVAESVSSIQSDLTSPPNDTTIPDFFDEALAQFAILLKSYDSSLTPASSRQQDFEPIISQALDPFLAACEKLSKMLSEPKSDIFSLNFLVPTQSTLSPYAFTASKSRALGDQAAVVTDSLTGYQHAFFLHTSGLHPLLVVVSEQSFPLTKDSITTISSHPRFQAQALADASTNLDEFLPSALMDAMENVRGLISRDAARRITAEAAERFCEDFELVESALARIDEVKLGERGLDRDDEDEGREGGEGMENGVVRLKDLFPRTSGEIRVLLS